MDLLNKVETSILNKVEINGFNAKLMDLLNKVETSILSKINGFVK